MKRTMLAVSVASLIALSASPAVFGQDTASPGVIHPTDRTVLPLPEPQYPHSAVLDARNATPPPRFEIKAPAKAPNVLIVLIDDMGFGVPTTFGGPVSMPTLDALAQQGLRCQ